MECTRCLLIAVSIVLLCATPACTRRTLKKRLHLSPKELSVSINKTNYNAPPITVWIHGTRFVRRSFFYGFFKGTPCLRLAKELGTDYHLHHVTRALSKASPNEFPLDTFYLFGWSGKLNVQERTTAAQHLHAELNRIVADYEMQYNCHPHIRIITHSHGGNIALNMAEFKKSDDALQRVNELILLACPVQHNTRKYVEDPLFKKTYSFYSSIDVAQVIAPQFTHKIHSRKGRIRSEIHWPPVSSRRFQAHPKLIQARVKLNGRALFHTEFSAPHFAHLLPHILHATEALENSIERKHLLCVYTNRTEPTKKISADHSANARTC